jgi:putative PIN family toxin of toxin-antitoxin system
MPNHNSRIVIDTNLWVSFLITKDFTKLDTIIFARQGTLVFSQELLDEFLEVVNRPKYFFSETVVVELLETIEEFADFVNVRSEIKLCRDPKDNFLLSLSLDGNADYLLTGDKDLLDLAKFEKTKITTITDFLQGK